MKKIFFIPALLISLVSAQANDSTVTLGTGGLVFKKTADINIVSERLRISPKKITVDYEMKLLRSEPLEVDIAFPLAPSIEELLGRLSPN